MPAPFAGSAKKAPWGSDLSKRSLAFKETSPVGVGETIGAVVASLPALTHPRSTQKERPSLAVNRVKTSYP